LAHVIGELAIAWTDEAALVKSEHVLWNREAKEMQSSREFE